MERIGKTSSYSVTDEVLEVNAQKPGEPKKPPLVKAVRMDGGIGFQIPTDMHVDGSSSGTLKVELVGEEESFLYVFKYGLHEKGSKEWLISAGADTMSHWNLHQHFRVDEKAPIRSDAVAGFEQWVDPDGDNLARLLHTLHSQDREFRKEFDDSMTAAFGQTYEELVFVPTADGRIQMKIRWRSLKKPQSASALSDGTLRYLYLMAILLNPSPPSLICIDEPETGLHPSMFPLVAEAAQEAAMRTQVILTTHSPEFLNHFTEAEKETGGVVSVMYLKDGASEIRRLSGEPLTSWLKRYKLGQLMMSGELEELAEEDDE
ncbi:MAG: AAA family ATPase [Deltaproteobacteria bacterium]|nr:AAA family ATPase [Deltaproteobacteria bacterium]